MKDESRWHAEDQLCVSLTESVAFKERRGGERGQTARDFRDGFLIVKSGAMVMDCGCWVKV